MIDFVHFNGTAGEWATKKPNYGKAIVFACIWDASNKPAYKIYAGQSGHTGPNGESVEYLYDIPTAAEWNDIKKQLALIDINEAGEFTSDKFKAAIENYLATGSVTIQAIQDAITWKIVGDN